MHVRQSGVNEGGVTRAPGLYGLSRRKENVLATGVNEGVPALVGNHGGV